MFPVEDVEREQARLTAREICLTGPMVGPKMKTGHGRPHELELAATESLGLDAELLKALGRSAPGTRRDLLLWPSELRHELCADGSLVVEFTLPAGAYASLVIRAFTRNNPWAGPDRASEDVREEDHGE